MYQTYPHQKLNSLVKNGLTCELVICYIFLSGILSNTLWACYKNSCFATPVCTSDGV
ncbi:hypothetical protein Hanom_Chr11g01046131 [Helianthus anomalus]